MAKFCKECPMRGTMNGEVEGAFSGPYSFDANRWSYAQSHSGYVGSLEDGLGGISKPIYMPSLHLADTAIEARIDQCDQPTESFERKGMLRKVTRKLGCPAIGSLYITDPSLRGLVMPDIRRAALANAELKPQR